MKRLGILLAALGACALVAARETPRSRAAPRWWKGNTHAHTLWSDGDGAPELVADWYRSKGYHFLVLSDHNVLSTGERWFPISAEGRLTPARVEDLRARFGAERVDVREVDGRREMRLRTLEELRGRFEAEGAFLFIEGEEITDAWNEQRPVHVNGLNLAEAIPPQGGATVRETLQRNVDAVLAQGERLGRPVLAHVNHPNFGWGLTAADLASLRGDRFFEVYNGHPAVRNRGDGDHAGTEAMWDIALALRLTALDLGPLYGIATDDAHSYFEVALDLANAGRGWVMVRAPELTVGALLDAMQRGDFHASSGVTLEDVAHDETSYTVRIAAEPGVTYRTRFFGTRLSDSVLGEIGELLLETEKNPAVYAFAGDELYVRATVVSSRPHPNPYAPGDPEMAWTQPAVLGSEENPRPPAGVPDPPSEDWEELIPRAADAHGTLGFSIPIEGLRIEIVGDFLAWVERHRRLLEGAGSAWEVRAALHRAFGAIGYEPQDGSIQSDGSGQPRHLVAREPAHVWQRDRVRFLGRTPDRTTEEGASLELLLDGEADLMMMALECFLRGDTIETEDPLETARELASLSGRQPLDVHGVGFPILLGILQQRGRDEPTPVSLPPWPESLEDARVECTGVLGELGIRGFSARIPLSSPPSEREEDAFDPEALASGWDGDRRTFARTDDGTETLSDQADGAFVRRGPVVDWAWSTDDELERELMRRLEEHPLEPR